MQEQLALLAFVFIPSLSDALITDQNKQTTSSNNKKVLLSKFITVFVPHLSPAPGTCKPKS